MRLQVLPAPTGHLQCAKLKVRVVSGGRNRAGALLVSSQPTRTDFPPPSARGALLLLSPYLSLSGWNILQKIFAPVFAQFKLLMFVNKVCRALISSWIWLCSAVWFSARSPNSPDTELNSSFRLGAVWPGVKWWKISEKFDHFPKKLGVILLQSEICCVGPSKRSEHTQSRSSSLLPPPSPYNIRDLQHWTWRLSSGAGGLEVEKRGNCRLQAARMEEDNTRTGGGGWTRRLIRTEGKHWSCSSGCWSSNVVIQMRLQQYQLSPPASNIL